MAHFGGEGESRTENTSRGLSGSWSRTVAMSARGRGLWPPPPLKQAVLYASTAYLPWLRALACRGPSYGGNPPFNFSGLLLAFLGTAKSCLPACLTRTHGGRRPPTERPAAPGGRALLEGRSAPRTLKPGPKARALNLAFVF